MRPVTPLALALGGHQLAGGATPVDSAAKPKEVRSARAEQNRLAELTFISATRYADPFNTVSLDVIITDPEGQARRVPGFWAGGDRWKVRYASGKVGTHSYRTVCSDPANPGLQDLTGRIEVTPYTGENPLYRHGPVQVAGDRRHLQYADGTPFFWLGDTWWMGLCRRLHWPGDFRKLTADRVEKGFTVIQIVAGLYPDMFAFDPRGANEAGFPWEAEYKAIRPEYFDAADRRLQYLADNGLTPCVVGAWGYFLPWMGVEKLQQHWRYLVARYGALPVVWCVAGEANLPWYLAPGFPYDDREAVKGWTQVARYLRQVDPYHRPVSIHPTGLGRLSARGAIDDPALLDFDMLQTGHGGRQSLPPTVETLRWSYDQKPRMPVLNSEVSYEALGGVIPADVQRLMFWASMLSGAAGHTYGANGIWQVNRTGDPHGASPHGGNYGTIPWEEAMNLPGSAQLALAKRLLERLPWQRFEPHPQWASLTTPAPLSLDGCQWIWFPEGNPAQDAPAEKRWFRKSFELPAGRRISGAVLRLSADDSFEATLNGEVVGSHAEWGSGREFRDVARLLHEGRNVLAVMAANKPATGPNPAGLICALEVQLAGGEMVRVVSDGSWRTAKAEAPGWQEPGFDDRAWVTALALGPHGMPPWGVISGANAYEVPYCAGIPGSLRVIYVPRQQAVTVRKLEPGVTYCASLFDPTTGATQALGAVQGDARGTWTCFPPGGPEPDWVLILQAQQKVGEGPERSSGHMTLESDALRWHLETAGGAAGVLRSTAFDNKLTGHTFALGGAQELAVVLSAAPDRVQEPVTRVEDFAPAGPAQWAGGQAVIPLRSASSGLEARLHYALEGPTRRKWAEVSSPTRKAVLVLDVELDGFGTGAPATGGGEGMPLFLGDEAFAAVEYPSGENTAGGGRVKLAHFPGRLLAPGGNFTTHSALVSVSAQGQARQSFVDYLAARARRRGKVLSVYTPFGINNQWGPCPALTDEETLDVLGVLGKFQRQGVRFDYFTLDTGWVDPAGDLTRFRPNAYPKGPGKVVARVEELGMKLGLWFATSWAAESCWDYPPAWAGQGRPQMAYLNGAPDKVGFPGSFCFGAEAYSSLVRRAVLHHVRDNGVRFIKFDGGNYRCDSTEHGHLPGKYSTERMFGTLIDIARAAREAAPDVFVMWYWGLRSPFWALYGDTIFESGIHMEGSGTSSFPTLHYRDSVTLAQDQTAQYAALVPPVAKDSLGVWLADTRWGNFMGKDRWREALVMDLGRGSLLFPNLWGDLYLLDDEDVRFLAWIGNLARKNQALFQHRRTLGGDPWHNDVYGYAHFGGPRGFLFLNNAGFVARQAQVPLDGSVGLQAAPGAPLSVVARFPEQEQLLRPGGKPYRAGGTLKLWLRPFEVLMVEVKSGEAGAEVPVRRLTAGQAADLGTQLALGPCGPDPALEIRFSDEAGLVQRGFAKQAHLFSATLPPLQGPAPILAVAVQLRQGEAEWKYSPFVAQIAQVRARVGDQNLQLMPVPDARQFGNTQAAGCSWVVYHVRLNPEWSGRRLAISTAAWLPPGVEAHVQAWVVKRWWQQSARPSADGYYSNAPS